MLCLEFIVITVHCFGHMVYFYIITWTEIIFHDNITWLRWIGSKCDVRDINCCVIYVDSSVSLLLFTYMVRCHNEDSTYIHGLLFTLRCCVYWNCLNKQDCCDAVISVLKPSNGPETKYFNSEEYLVMMKHLAPSVQFKWEKHTKFYFCAISCFMLLSLFSVLMKC